MGMHFLNLLSEREKNNWPLAVLTPQISKHLSGGGIIYNTQWHHGKFQSDCRRARFA